MLKIVWRKFRLFRNKQAFKKKVSKSCKASASSSDFSIESDKEYNMKAKPKLTVNFAYFILFIFKIRLEKVSYFRFRSCEVLVPKFLQSCWNFLNFTIKSPPFFWSGSYFKTFLFILFIFRIFFFNFFVCNK